MAKVIYGIFGTGGFAREVMPAAHYCINANHSHLSVRDIEVVFIETKPQKKS